MVNGIVASLLLVLATSPAQDQAAPAAAPVVVPAQVYVPPVVSQAQEPPLKVAESMNLSGPRVGVTFLSDGVVRKLRGDSGPRADSGYRGDSGYGIEVGSLVSQFGWQKEKRFYSGNNGLTAVTEWVFLVGGFEQGLVLPSFSWLVGLRTIKGVEFAVGPNVSPAGAALAAAAGVTFRSGNLNFPVNLAVVPSKSGMRVSLLAGFNSRKR